jgi:hypothetical protein
MQDSGGAVVGVCMAAQTSKVLAFLSALRMSLICAACVAMSARARVIQSVFVRMHPLIRLRGHAPYACAHTRTP